MFSDQYFWRISNLVTTLNKKNHIKNIAEISKVEKMYGEEGRGTIQVLLDEIDFKDQRSQGHKDTQKVIHYLIFNYI
jgi:hypothetical protein